MSERYVLDGKPLYTLEEYRRLKNAYNEAIAVVKHQVSHCSDCDGKGWYWHTGPKDWDVPIRRTCTTCKTERDFLAKRQDSPTRANDQTTSD